MDWVKIYMEKEDYETMVQGRWTSGRETVTAL